MAPDVPEPPLSLPCGCIAYAEGDEIHLVPCSADHDQPLIEAAKRFGETYGIPVEVTADLPDNDG